MSVSIIWTRNTLVSTPWPARPTGHKAAKTHYFKRFPVCSTNLGTSTRACMPQNRAGLVIATYEGVKVDWPVLIADGLCAAIESVRGKEGRKIWHAVAQWLTLLAPPVEPVKTTKRGRATEGTPKMASKRQQLLASKATKGKTVDAEKAARERATWKRPGETQEERTLKIKFRRPVQQETDTLAARINIGTQEEEAEEELEEHL